MEEDGYRRDGKPEWWRRFWIEAAIASVVLSGGLFALYFYHFINLHGLSRGMVSILFAISFAYMIQHIKSEVLSGKTLLTVNKVVYIIGGGSAGILASFGVAGILRGLGLPPMADLIGAWPSVILLLVVAPGIGGYLGYRIGKRRDFQPPRI